MSTINQRYKNGSMKKKDNFRTPALQLCPQVRGTVMRARIVTPRKPNSAKRPVGKVILVNKKRVTAHIPGVGHNIRRYSKVLVRGGGSRDLPGVRYSLIRGVMDFSGLLKKKRRRSIYGAPQPDSLKKIRKKHRKDDGFAKFDEMKTLMQTENNNIHQNLNTHEHNVKINDRVDLYDDDSGIFFEDNSSSSLSDIFFFEKFLVSDDEIDLKKINFDNNNIEKNQLLIFKEDNLKFFTFKNFVFSNKQFFDYYLLDFYYLIQNTLDSFFFEFIEISSLNEYKNSKNNINLFIIYDFFQNKRFYINAQTYYNLNNYSVTYKNANYITTNLDYYNNYFLQISRNDILKFLNLFLNISNKFNATSSISLLNNYDLLNSFLYKNVIIFFNIFFYNSVFSSFFNYSFFFKFICFPQITFKFRNTIKNSTGNTIKNSTGNSIKNSTGNTTELKFIVLNESPNKIIFYKTFLNLEFFLDNVYEDLKNFLIVLRNIRYDREKFFFKRSVRLKKMRALNKNLKFLKKIFFKKFFFFFLKLNNLLQFSSLKNYNYDFFKKANYNNLFKQLSNFFLDLKKIIIFFNYCNYSAVSNTSTKYLLNYQKFSLNFQSINLFNLKLIQNFKDNKYFNILSNQNKFNTNVLKKNKCKNNMLYYNFINYNNILYNLSHFNSFTKIKQGVYLKTSFDFKFFSKKLKFFEKKKNLFIIFNSNYFLKKKFNFSFKKISNLYFYFF